MDLLVRFSILFYLPWWQPLYLCHSFFILMRGLTFTVLEHILILEGKLLRLINYFYSFIQISMESMLDLWWSCLELAKTTGFLIQRVRCLYRFWEMEWCGKAILMRTNKTQNLVHWHKGGLGLLLIQVKELQGLLRNWLIRWDNIDLLILNLAPKSRKLWLRRDL